jgi:hypothetical protein
MFSRLFGCASSRVLQFFETNSFEGGIKLESSLGIIGKMAYTKIRQVALCKAEKKTYNDGTFIRGAL